MVQRLRVAHKVLISVLLLLLPTLALLYYFTITVDATIRFAERERCGLRYDAPLRQLLHNAVTAQPAAASVSAIAQLRALDAQPCTSASHAGELQTAGAADQLSGLLSRGSPAPLRQAVSDWRATIRDESNLILDPDLDTYYVQEVLFRSVGEAIELLAGPAAPTAARLEAHIAQLQRSLDVAIAHNDSYAGSRDTLEPAITATRARYLATLRELDAPAARAPAIAALFAFAEAAAAWQDRALDARIDDRRQWKHRTYAIVGALLLIGAGIAALVVHDVVRRLRELVAQSRRIARGELGPAVAVQGSDELALLQGTFNTMAAELQQLYSQMERRVRDRTAEAEAAEARFRAIVEATPEAILMTDHDGTIVLVNAQAETLFGYSRDELIGEKVDTLVPLRDRARHIAGRQSYMDHPSPRTVGPGRELHALRKDGSEVPVEIKLSGLQTREGQFAVAGVIDVTQRKAAERLLREAETHALRCAILNSFPAAVIATDVAGSIVAANPAAERLLGYSREELLGRASILLHDPEELARRAQELSKQLGQHIAPAFAAIAGSVRNGETDEREWTCVRKDGSRVPVQIALTALRDEAGQLSGFLKVAHDITARKRAEAFIHHMAYHDALTGLPNRVLLLDRLAVALRQAERHGDQVAVLLMDLDHFKRINDLLGHHIGDQLLVTIADRIEHVVRAIDTVARLGGDEFVLVLTEVRARADVEAVIAKLFKVVAAPVHVESHELQVTPSVGGCLFPADGGDAATLLKHADAAMYQAKARGRNAVQWFTATMLQESQEKLELGQALRHALGRGELALHYQPELSLRTRRVIGLEALVRWQRGDVGIPPDRFIPLAEDSGLIMALGEWSLRRACEDCVQLQRQLGRRLSVAVNVSPLQFQQPGWPATISTALRASGLHANQLELEVTESMLMQNPEEAAETLRAIRALGVGIVIDDFGTGYSSLAYLTRFPVDKIKIDRSFVHNLPSDSNDAAVIDAILAMAQRLGMRVIAEGVEREDQQHYLRRQGCDEVQGFLYSQGLPVAELPLRLDAIEASCTPDPDGASGARVA